MVHAYIHIKEYSSQRWHMKGMFYLCNIPLVVYGFEIFYKVYHYDDDIHMEIGYNTIQQSIFDNKFNGFLNCANDYDKKKHMKYIY